MISRKRKKMAGAIALTRTVETLMKEDDELHRIIQDAYQQFCLMVTSNWLVHQAQIRKFLRALEIRRFVKLPRGMLDFSTAADADKRREQICRILRRILFEESPSFLLKMPPELLRKILNYLNWPEFSQFFAAISKSPRARLVASRYALMTHMNPLTLSLRGDEKFELIARVLLNIILCSVSGIAFYHGARKGKGKYFCKIFIFEGQRGLRMGILIDISPSGLFVLRQLQKEFDIEVLSRRLTFDLPIRLDFIQEILVIASFLEIQPVKIGFWPDAIPYTMHVVPSNPYIVMDMLLSSLTHREKANIDFSALPLFINFTELTPTNIQDVDQKLVEAIYSTELALEQALGNPLPERSRTKFYNFLHLLQDLTRHTETKEIVRDLVDIQLFLFDIYRSLMVLGVDEEFSMTLTEMPLLERRLMSTVFTETFALTRLRLALSHNLALASSRTFTALRYWYHWRDVVKKFGRYTTARFVQPESDLLIV
jgi:hypothetical protein